MTFERRPFFTAPSATWSRWDRIANEVREVNISTICDKEELNWPLSLYKFHLVNILALLIKNRVKRLFSRSESRP